MGANGPIAADSPTVSKAVVWFATQRKGTPERRAACTHRIAREVSSQISAVPSNSPRFRRIDARMPCLPCRAHIATCLEILLALILEAPAHAV